MSDLKRVSKIAAKIGAGVLTERVLTVLTRILIDAPMIYLFARGFSVINVASIFIPWCFVFYSTVICVYDYCAISGYDLLGLNYLTELEYQSVSRRQIAKRIGQWVIKRKITIFLLGSLFVLDPDVVSIMLRKKGTKGFEILAGSVTYSIIFWSVIYWLGVRGYEYVSYFLE